MPKDEIVYFGILQNLQQSLPLITWVGGGDGEGIQLRSNSLVTPQGLDKRSDEKAVPNMERWSLRCKTVQEVSDPAVDYRRGCKKNSSVLSRIDRG